MKMHPKHSALSLLSQQIGIVGPVRDCGAGAVIGVCVRVVG